MKNVFKIFIILNTFFTAFNVHANALDASFQTELTAHLKVLSSNEYAGRKPGTKGHQQAQRYIEQNFTITTPRNVYNPLQVQTFNYRQGFTDKQGKNFIFTQIGSKYPSKYIVITAHYDHLGKQRGKIFNGADDNASGTAMLMTLKSWLARKTLSHSIMLVATDAEESGFHGAKHFLDSNYIDAQDIKLNLNLDMVAHGYKQKGLYVVGLKNYPQFTDIIEKLNQQTTIEFKARERIVSKQAGTLKQRINLHKASDHYQFHLRGIPYIFLTGDNHKYYHTDKDTFEKIDLKFFNDAFIAINQLILMIDSDF
ncbi:M28 family peptidase [Colwelliaceae bacterium BS250]